MGMESQASHSPSGFAAQAGQARHDRIHAELQARYRGPARGRGTPRGHRPCRGEMARGRLRQGIDVFFVLSGYLITGLLIKELQRTGRLDLTRFYARRLQRLLPGLLLMLATTGVGAALLLAPFEQAPQTPAGMSACAVGQQLLFRLLQHRLFRPDRGVESFPAHVVARCRGAVLPGLARAAAVPAGRLCLAGFADGFGASAPGTGRYGRPWPCALGIA